MDTCEWRVLVPVPPNSNAGSFTYLFSFFKLFYLVLSFWGAVRGEVERRVPTTAGLGEEEGITRRRP